MLDRERIELGHHEGAQRRHPLPLLLQGHAEVAQAHFVGRVHGLVRPDAAMQAGVGGGPHVAAQIHRLTTGDTQQAVGLDTGLLQHPHRLVTADQPG